MRVERLLLKSPDDPVISEVSARMIRFVCRLETEEERYRENAYIAETALPLVFTRYTADRFTGEKNSYVCTAVEKNETRICLAPGCAVFIAFMNRKTGLAGGEELAMALRDGIARRVPGARGDGNDVLLGGKKAAGITVLINPDAGTAMARLALTMESAALREAFPDESFAGRKYAGITGIADGTGLSPEKAREILWGLPDIAEEWRSGG
jgi:hypothetical protein